MSDSEERRAVNEPLAVGERIVTRRDILKLAGAGTAFAALSPIIAACGGGGATTAPQNSPNASPTGGGGSPAASGVGASPAASAAGSPAASAAASPAASASAGGSAIQPPATAVNIDFWNPFTGGDGPYLRGIVDRFNQETPNVQVKFSTQKDLYGALHAAQAAKRLPHVSIVHLDAIPQNAADGIFAPIDELITTLGLGAQEFTTDVWEKGEYKGARYGVPLDIHTMTFYWNKALFTAAGLDPENPPQSADEFKAAAKAITDKAGSPGFMVVQGGGGANFLLGIEWATVFYQLGGEWTNADFSQVTINTDPAIQSANYWKSFVDEGISPKGTESDSEIAAFKQGKLGMVFSGIWETNGYAEALGENFGTAPVPPLFGEGVWAGSHNMGITTREMSPDELQGAQYFISWLSQNSLDWAKAGQIPARTSVREASDFAALPHIPAIAEGAANARFFPAIPAAANLLFGPQGAGQAAVAVVTGKKEAKAAFDEAAANLTKELQANKQKYGF